MSKLSLPFLASALIIILTSFILSFYRPPPTTVITPTCTPRPKCLDASGSARCLMSETPDMCPTTTFPQPCLTVADPCHPQACDYNPEKCHGYTCPPSGWVDCLPGPGPAKPQCQKDYLDWIKVNCPDFSGVAY